MVSTVVVTPAAGQKLVQPPSRAVWGWTVAPGSYRSMTEVGSRGLCVAEEIPSQLIVVGVLGGIVDISGAS